MAEVELQPGWLQRSFDRLPKSIAFRGKCSGDGECFCWEVTKEEYIKAFGEGKWKQEMADAKERMESWPHQHNMKFEESKSLIVSPDEVLRMLEVGIDDENEYDFQITVSKVVPSPLDDPTQPKISTDNWID